MKLKKALCALLASAMVFSMAACGGESSAPSGDANTIVVARPADSNNLDPVTCVGNTNIWIFNLILEGLVKTSDDGTSIEPCLAESWTVSDDQLTYTFKLKEGVKFSDGTPVTGEDWVWTFERAMTTEGSKWTAAIEAIESVEAPDDSTFIVHLSHPAAATMANLSMFTLGVQSKAYYEKVGADEYKNGIIGTGPYMLKEWKKSESITLEKNPNYHIEGLPKTQTIVFKVVADDNARMMQLQAGEIDIATQLSLSTMKQLESDSNVKVDAGKSTISRFMALNTENEYLSNKQVRQAINMVTDPQQVVDMAMYGYGTAAATFLSDTSAYIDKSLTVNKPDVEGAKKLMEEAGYADGFTIDMMIHAGNALEEQMATILQQQWAQIGITVEIAAYESTTYTDNLYGMKFDSVIDYWSDDIADPSQFMTFICDFDMCSGFDTNYQNPRLVELNDAANVEGDVEKRKELYNEIQELIHDEAIFVPLCYEPYANAYRSNMEGFVQTPLGNFRFENLVKNVG